MTTKKEIVTHAQIEDCVMLDDKVIFSISIPDIDFNNHHLDLDYLQEKFEAFAKELFQSRLPLKEKA